ncbi:HAD family hydrolase [Salinisphaera japonica]|uniref:CbbY n=1 Tax=Salinisphaera japonica YTM-1 TaxID=1209778 RepID=A0A423PT29_9GAMM|nr:HAD-IA family hydrolase [Salinisphaera japonica]ROO28753.1 CbbY [Salinisphaera japonica YTM-1]
MSYNALIFGGIGSLVETSHIQLACFNEAFANLGIDFVWTEGAYAESLNDSGGHKRLAELSVDDGRTLTDDEIANVHAEKTRLFQEHIVRDGLTLRDGVPELLHAAMARGAKLAWATTTARENIMAIFKAVEDLAPDMFEFIGDDSRAENSQPATDIYDAALAAMNLSPDAAVAIEDNPKGVAATKAAGLYTIAFPGAMHVHHDFSTADKRLASLADAAMMIAE